MVKIRFSTTVTIYTLFVFLLLLSSSFAGSEVKDNIVLNTPEYESHKETFVLFSHKKHLSTESENGYGIACGECHHDEEGKSLDLQLGDEVDRCVSCHSNTGKKLKDEKLSKKQEVRKYHKKALHANCRNCHGKFNKKNNLKKDDLGAAPTGCKGCHPKE